MQDNFFQSPYAQDVRSADHRNSGICEICNHEIPSGRENAIPAVTIVSATRSGYNPLSESWPTRPIEQLRENFWAMFEMHEPEWTVCSSCRDIISRYADSEVKIGPLPPELILIFGNGFQPEPKQWRAFMGAWLHRWDEKGIQMPISGAATCVTDQPRVPLSDFVELVPQASQKFPGQLVDDLIFQDPESDTHAILLAIWSAKDSPAMKKFIHAAKNQTSPSSNPPVTSCVKVESQGHWESTFSKGYVAPSWIEDEVWKPGNLVACRIQVRAVKRGSMGLVYFCQDYSRGRTIPYVIKTLPKGTLIEHKELFLREASTWVQLGVHPHVVMALGAGELEERPCLFLEYIQGDVQHGADLSGWIGAPDLTLQRALAFAWQICAGMSYAAEKLLKAGRAFVHRDLKPSNVLVASPKQVKITDFGASLVYDLIQTSSAAKSQLLGTNAYKSPEQCRGDQHIDIRSDVYSFGCLLYEMLTARTIFGLPHTAAEFIRMHRELMPENPRKFNTEFPPALDDLVMRCLQKDPASRYSDFAVLQDELRRIHERLFGIPPVTFPLEEIPEVVLRQLKAATVLLGADSPEALKELTRLEPMGDDDASAFIVKSEAMAKLGQREESLLLLEDVLRLQKSKQFFAEVWHQKARLLGDLGRFEEAVQACDQALALNPTDRSVLNTKGYGLLALGQPKEALACLEECLLSQEGSRMAAVWNNKGRAHGELRDWKEASRCYEKSIALYESEADVWLNWSFAAHNLGQHDKERARLRRCLAIEPNHWKALHNLGVLLRDRNDEEEDVLAFDEAVEAQKTFVRKHPENLEFLAQLVFTLCGVERKSEVLDLLADFLCRDGTDQILTETIAAGAVMASFHNFLAARKEDETTILLAFNICLERKMPAEALVTLSLAWMSDILARYPTRGRIYLAKGLSELVLSSAFEALQTFDQGARYSANDSALWHFRAHALARLERWGDVVASCDRGLRCDPNGFGTLLIKVQALKKSGKFAEALEVVEFGLEMKPNDVDFLKEKTELLDSVRRRRAISGG